MTDSDAEKIMRELGAMREQMDAILRAVAPPAAERPDDIVGVAYVAEVTGLAERTVRDRKAGTDRIPRVRTRPVGYLRADVHKFVRELREQQSSKQRRPISLVRRRPRKKAA